MLNKDTIHIPDNLSRWEIFILYREYAEAVEGVGNFITYSYFTRLWKNEFNNVRIPKKTRMGVCSTCASLKEKRDKCQGEERGMRSKHYFLKLDNYQLWNYIYSYVYFILSTDFVVRELQENRNQ